MLPHGVRIRFSKKVSLLAGHLLFWESHCSQGPCLFYNLYQNSPFLNMKWGGEKTLAFLHVVEVERAHIQN